MRIESWIFINSSFSAAGRVVIVRAKRDKHIAKQIVRGFAEIRNDKCQAGSTRDHHGTICQLKPDLHLT